MSESEQTTKTAQIKNKRYEIAPDLAELAQGVLATKRLSVHPARIKYVLVYPNIDKRTAARCMTANPMVTFFGDCDYVMQFSGDLYDALAPELREILMYHELLHILCTQNEKSGEWKFSLRDHDVNEFSEIINAYGIHWLDKVRETFIESGGFDPDEIDILGI